MGRVKERGGGVEERKKRKVFPSSPTPSFIFWATKTENPVLRSSLVFLCFETTRKRLLRRLGYLQEAPVIWSQRIDATRHFPWIGSIPVTWIYLAQVVQKVNNAINRKNYYQNDYNQRNRAKEVRFFQWQLDQLNFASDNDNISFPRPGSACYPPDKSLSRG